MTKNIDQIQAAIVKADVSHADLLRNLSEQTFRETYTAGTDPASLELHIHTKFTLSVVETDLQHPQTHYFLAKYDGQWAGYTLLRTNRTHELLHGTKAIMLDRIYVLKSFLRHKIGSILLQHSIDFAKQASCEWLWLMVWEENKRALAFYEKWGFEHFGYERFHFGNDVYEDMALRKRV